jgi:hypothetical protein
VYSVLGLRPLQVHVKQLHVGHADRYYVYFIIDLCIKHILRIVCIFVTHYTRTFLGTNETVHMMLYNGAVQLGFTPIHILGDNVIS